MALTKAILQFIEYTFNQRYREVVRAGKMDYSDLEVLFLFRLMVAPNTIFNWEKKKFWEA